VRIATKHRDQNVLVWFNVWAGFMPQSQTINRLMSVSVRTNHGLWSDRMKRRPGGGEFGGGRAQWFEFFTRDKVQFRSWRSRSENTSQPDPSSCCFRLRWQNTSQEKYKPTLLDGTWDRHWMVCGWISPLHLCL